jgi:nicotinamidase-related amidase
MDLQHSLCLSHTALILIGYQNDYYSTEGILHKFLEDTPSVRASLGRTVQLLEHLAHTGVTIIETPIVFTPDYQELQNPVGILAAIRDAKAFQAGTWGGETVPELAPFRDRILSVPGKRGLNAFMGTHLEEILRARGINDVVLCGSVASICIDSTGRHAAEQGYRVAVVGDCITGRTRVEHEFYNQSVFPLYAEVLTAEELTRRLVGAQCLSGCKERSAWSES